MTTPPALDGDNWLSGKELKLWGIHQRVLLEFGVYTVFQWRRVHVPNQQRELIQWFVPEQAPNALRVVEWLQYELEKEQREDIPSTGDDDPPYPGCDVSMRISLFSGVDPHVERDIMEPIIHDSVQRFLRELEGKGKKDG